MKSRVNEATLALKLVASLFTRIFFALQRSFLLNISLSQLDLHLLLPQQHCSFALALIQTHSFTSSKLPHITLSIMSSYVPSFV